MSKVGPPVNGDYNDPMGMRSRDYLRDEWGEKVNKMFSCDVDHMYASVNEVQTRDREVEKLKDMLLVNLDLIQTQSETITARDKEIVALKREIDALRLRFQRMERRVTLQRHRDDPPTPSAALGAPPDSCQPQAVAGPSLYTPMPVAMPISAPQPQRSLTPALTPVTTKRRRGSAGVGAKRGRRRTHSSGSARSKRTRSASDSNDVELEERKSRTRNVLSTDTPYHTVAGDTTWSPIDLLVKPDPETTPLEETVQVPSWRLKVLSPLYVIEGTENLEDEVFLKRHHKLECDERRRKRWDIQRIREQTQLERLKQRTDKKVKTPAASAAEPIYSLFPSIDDVEVIAVSPTLPVVAFGLPLRTFDSSEFNLPWTSFGGHRYVPVTAKLKTTH